MKKLQNELANESRISEELKSKVQEHLVSNIIVYMTVDLFKTRACVLYSYF